MTVKFLLVLAVFPCRFPSKPYAGRIPSPLMGEAAATWLLAAYVEAVGVMGRLFERVRLQMDA